MKRFIVIILLINNFLTSIYADNYMEPYAISPADSEEIHIESDGWLEYEYFDKIKYRECHVWDLDESQTEINQIQYYFGDKTDCIKINRQEFYFPSNNIFYETMKFYKISYKGINSILARCSTATLNCICMFIFDVTDKNNIKVFLLKNIYYDSRIDDRVFGIFKGKLCFFSADRVHDYNGEYFYVPYVIKNNELQEMTDASGKQYRVYFNVSYPGNVVTVKKKTF
jgi:hypothetical protein